LNGFSQSIGSESVGVKLKRFTEVVNNVFKDISILQVITLTLESILVERNNSRISSVTQLNIVVRENVFERQ
jgi:hypothetical protein